MTDREYDPNPEDERVEVLDEDDAFGTDAPPTLDPDERIEERDDLDPEAPADA